VTLTYRIVAEPDAHGSHAHGGHHGRAHIERMQRFSWPVDGWVRGARVDVFGPGGASLPQARLHHANLINFTRRQLVHPGFERLWGAGQETAAAMLPAGVGVPMNAGMEIGLVVAYVPADLEPGSSVRVQITWTPANMVPRPADLLPVSVTVNYRIGASAAYDLPAGHSVDQFEFTLPIGGRLIGAGGHLHDYGVELRLEEVESGRVIARLRGIHHAGRIQGVERALLGVTGNGKRLRASTRYRLVVAYANPGAAIPGGAMGSMGLGFVPDRLADWPMLQEADPDIATDLAHLMSFERRDVSVSPAR
jgi:hypothetical protein